MSHDQHTKDKVENEQRTEKTESGRKRSKSVRKVVSNFADTTSVAGLSFIKNADTWYKKVPWIIFFLAALGMLTLQMVLIFERYYSYPTNTKVELLQKSGGLDFPTVTLCNLNAVRAEKLSMSADLNTFVNDVQAGFHSDGGDKADYLGDVAGIGGIDDDYYEYEGTDYHDDDGLFTGTVDSYTKLRKSFKDLLGHIAREDTKIMSTDREMSIQKCVFNGKTCYPNNFTTIWSKEYGNCFSFNSHFDRESPLRSRFTGSEFGLSLQLYKDDANYLSVLTQGGGFRVAVHPFGTQAFPLEDGLSVSPGKEAFIALEYENITRPGGRFGACAGDEDYKKLFNSKYTKKACENTCSERLIARNCGCIQLEDLESYPIMDRTKPPCATADELKCAKDTKKKTSLGTITCEDCIKACNDRHFFTEVTENVWPDYGMWSVLVDRLCHTDSQSPGCAILSEEVNATTETKDWFLKKDFLSLKIYFSDLTYHQFTEEPAYQLANFAADIGGTVGLWLGLSVFSGFEILNLFWQILRSPCKTKDKNYTKPSSQDA